MYSDRKWYNWLIPLGLMFADTLLACSSCNTGDSGKASQNAYLFITFLMGGIPMVSLGIFAVWYYLRSRRMHL